MPRPCQHAAIVTGCHLCHLYATRADYRKLWGGDPAPAAGTARLPLTLVPCGHLGERVPGQPCGSTLLRCDLHGDTTTRFVPCSAAERCCAGCPQNTVTAPRPDDPACGVAIGSFRWPELVDLQCHVIRETCGPVPILVSNDDPASHAALTTICARHPDVTLDTNPERIGHTGGDIACFHKGAKWGAARGLAAVCKLSQRFIVRRPRWIQDGARDLLASGLPLASRRCRGRENFGLRTECVLMAVSQWDTPAVLAAVAPRRYWTDLSTGLNAEMVIYNRVLRGLLGGVFWPWHSLMGEDRYHRDARDILWHCHTPAAEYRALGRRHGVVIPPDFHTDGWQGELARGTYLYG